MSLLSSWYGFSLIALLLYGSWGFWGVKAAPLINQTAASFYSSIGVLLAGLICLVSIKFHAQASPKGAVYAMLNGFSTGLACLFFIAALKKGPAVSVVMITSLYPVITTVLCIIFLHDKLNVHQLMGILCTIAALMFFAIA